MSSMPDWTLRPIDTDNLATESALNLMSMRS